MVIKIKQLPSKCLEINQIITLLDIAKPQF